MSTDKTRAHYEAMAAQAADVLALMQLACDMLDTGEFEVDRQAGRDLADAIPLVAELIAASRAIDERISYYASLGENDAPNIEQWAYTDQSGDVSRLRKALARTGSTP